jgi:hypothetical protein
LAQLEQGQTSASGRTNVFNGRPAVHFNGTSSYLTLTNFMNGVTAGGELFVVLKAGTVQPAHPCAPWDFSVQFGSQYPEGNGHITDGFASTTQQDVGLPSEDLTVPHVYDSCGANNLWQARLDGTLLYSSTTNAVTFRGNPYMGSIASFPNYFFSGDVAEMIVYDHVLTATDRAAVGQYLTAKYQIIQQPPSAPINLMASVNSPTQVTLSWKPVDHATSYSIERSSGGAFVQIAQVDNTIGYTDAYTTSYTDSNVPTGAIIQYRVRAMNYAGASPYSNIAYAVMTPDLIDPTDGLSYDIDALLGLNPLADNSGFLLAYPSGYGPPPPPPPDPNDHAGPVVTLLTPSQATLN